MRTFDIPEQVCPKCGKPISCATNLTSDRAPQPGQYTVCLGCAEVLQYGAKMHLHARPMSKVPMEMWDELDKARMAVLMFQRSQAQTTPRL